MTVKVRKGKFRIDDMIVVNGYTAGAYWNGWDCPYFEATAARYILETFYGESDIAHPNSWWEYDKEQDEFSALDGYEVDLDDDDVEEWINHWEGMDVELENGKIKHVYPIGAFAWIWSEVEDD